MREVIEPSINHDGTDGIIFQLRASVQKFQLDEKTGLENFSAQLFRNFFPGAGFYLPVMVAAARPR